jgi:hypothetical protein
VESSNTIDNVKAKIQYKEDWGYLSRPSLARRLVFDQLEASSTSLLLGRGFSDKSPPHTRSLRLARQVSASHEESPPCTRSLRLTFDDFLVRTSSLRLRPRHGPQKRGATPTHELLRNDTWEPIPHALQVRQLAAQAGSQL